MLAFHAALHGTDKPLNIPSSSFRPASREGEKANHVVETLSRAGWEILTSHPAPCFSWPLLFGAGWGGHSSEIILGKVPLLAVLCCTPQQPGIPKSTPAGGKQAVFLAPFPCTRLENSSQQATQSAAPNSGLQSTRSCIPSATQPLPASQHVPEQLCSDMEPDPASPFSPTIQCTSGTSWFPQPKQGRLRVMPTVVSLTVDVRRALFSHSHRDPSPWHCCRN